jgi:hypothetical protein
MAKDPYQSIDEFGVGSLLNTALKKCEEAKLQPKVSE